MSLRRSDLSFHPDDLRRLLCEPSTDNDDRFSRKKEKKEHVHTINCVSRGQTTFFTLLVFLVRLVHSSYCVVFNILIRHKRDLTEKQSLTGQF